MHQVGDRECVRLCPASSTGQQILETQQREYSDCQQYLFSTSLLLPMLHQQQSNDVLRHLHHQQPISRHLYILNRKSLKVSNNLRTTDIKVVR